MNPSSFSYGLNIGSHVCFEAVDSLGEGKRLKRDGVRHAQETHTILLWLLYILLPYEDHISLGGFVVVL